jgi:oligopeptidase B
MNKQRPNPIPPVAPRRAHVSASHGAGRVDPYHWLRQREAPAVRAYLEAENAYSRAMMRPSAAFQARLYREMLARIKQTDTEVPYRDGRFYYYSRTRKGRQYRIYCRRRDSLSAREQVILDLNEIARDKPFLGVGAMEVSPDAALLAYSTDFTGFREYTLRIKDLSSGRLLPDRVEKVRSVAWALDNRTLFYVTEDQTKRASRVWRRRLGQARGELLFEETDTRFSVGLGRSRSDRFIFISSHSTTTTEVRYVPADRPDAALSLFLPRRQEHEYHVDHGAEGFYVVTNDRGPNFRLVCAPVDSPGEANWRELVPHRDEVVLDGIDVFARHLVLHERQGGFPCLSVRRISDGATHALALPEPARSVYGGANAQFDTGAFRLVYESYVTPQSVYDYDLEARQLRLLKRREVRGGYDPEKYRVELHYAVAADGVRVPISLVFRRDRRRSGAQPMLLTGYGSYGIAHDVGFSSPRLSLLDRGMIFACAHVRGGGEMGRRWHDQGRLLQQAQHLRRFHRLRRTPHRRALHRACTAGDRGRQRRRPARGRGREHAARAFPRSGGAGAFRRRRQHDARRYPAADHRRVRGMGRSSRPDLLRLHAFVLAVR